MFKALQPSHTCNPASKPGPASDTCGRCNAGGRHLGSKPMATQVNGHPPGLRLMSCSICMKSG